MLTAGETLDETGHVAPSVRLVVVNRSSDAARFRAEIELIPDLPRMERALGALFESAWRAGRDGDKQRA